MQQLVGLGIAAKREFASAKSALWPRGVKEAFLYCYYVVGVANVNLPVNAFLPCR